jgi:hypothetical protein
MRAFEEFINESYNLNENLSVSDLDIRDGLLFVSINGNEYGYEPQGMSIQDVVDKFKSILKHNAGRALAWLKKNTELKVGSKKNEAEIFESLKLYEAASWGVDVSSPYSERDEKASMKKFKITVDPIVIVGVSGQIDEDHTEISIQFSNGYEIHYSYDAMGDEAIITKSDDNSVNIDISKHLDSYYGSTGTVVGDIALMYHHYYIGKIK